MTKINAAELMVTEINAINAHAGARVWVGRNEEGFVTKVRVYLDKGYIDLRDDNKANIEAVGRNYFEAAKSALTAVGYSRTYA